MRNTPADLDPWTMLDATSKDPAPTHIFPSRKDLNDHEYQYAKLFLDEIEENAKEVIDYIGEKVSPEDCREILSFENAPHLYYRLVAMRVGQILEDIEAEEQSEEN